MLEMHTTAMNSSDDLPNTPHRGVFSVLLASLALATFGVAASSQDPARTIDDVLAYHADGDSAVQLATSLFERDEVASFVVLKDSGAGTNLVYLDGSLIGTFSVNVGDTYNVPIPTTAKAGSQVDVFAGDGTLLRSVSVLERTYYRGNVLYSSFYGESPADLVDVVFLYNYVFNGGPAPSNLVHADVDGSGIIDVTDVLKLYFHVTGAITYDMPLGDIRYDGSLTTSNMFLASTVDDWSNGISNPPKKGEGAKDVDLDKNPKTTEWTFPCTHQWCGAGFPQYSTMSTAWGPRNPGPGVVPDGANSSFIWMLYCVSFATGQPVVSHKPIGKCMWPNGRNHRSVANGHAIYTSYNPDKIPPGPGGVNKEYKFDTNLATCVLTITLDNDGNGTHETPVYSGAPGGWSGWPAGVQ
jgi:hypothetical protein